MRQFLVVIVVLLGSVAAMGHDMFLVVPDHDLPADSTVTVALYNGTFDKSENAIERERMIDVSVVDGEARVSHPALEQWREDGNVTLLDFRTGSPGTYVVALSTKPRIIDLSAADFNDYLKHDGVLDVLEERRRTGKLGLSARERYSKHVKVILRVGGKATHSYSHRLGYPIEIVPLANPTELNAGDALEVLILAGGEPAAGQLVYASHAGYHSDGDDGTHAEAIRTRSDDAGVARIEISRPGRWYVRLIRMLPVDEDGLDYESNWATLTFDVK